MFNWAVDSDLLTHNPAAGIRRRTKEQSRTVVLTLDQIKSFWYGLDSVEMSPLIRIGLRLALVTGARRAEIIGINKAEIDLDARTWTLPAVRSKNGNEHILPLTDTALGLVNEAWGLSGDSEWLFPSNHSHQDVAFHPATLSRAIRVNRIVLGLDGEGSPSVHDLRRTVGTQLSAARVPRLIADKVLNHVDSSIGSIYDRHSYIDEKRDALERWERRLLLTLDGKNPDQVDGDNIVPLKVS